MQLAQCSRAQYNNPQKLAVSDLISSLSQWHHPIMLVALSNKK